MANSMIEKYRRILQELFEQHLEQDGFQKCRAYGEFLRKYKGFEQRICVGYEKSLGRHYYGLRLNITHSEFDKLYSEITESKQKKVLLWSYLPDHSSNGGNSLFCSFGPSRAYAFHEKDDEQRIVNHLYRVISTKLYPLADTHSSFEQIIQLIGQQSDIRKKIPSGLSDKIRDNEKYYYMMAIYLLAGYRQMAKRMFLNFTVPSKADWTIKSELMRLAPIFKRFPEQNNYCILCIGHLEDRYHSGFLNPSDSVIEQELLKMDGGYNESTAILEYQDDHSYLQIGGTPSGYTVEVRLYNEDGSFKHQSARLKNFTGENSIEVLYIDDHEVQVKKSQILTVEDAIACMIAFRHQKNFPDLVEWEDITGWFCE